MKARTLSVLFWLAACSLAAAESLTAPDPGSTGVRGLNRSSSAVRPPQPPPPPPPPPPPQSSYGIGIGIHNGHVEGGAYFGGSVGHRPPPPPPPPVIYRRPDPYSHTAVIVNGEDIAGEDRYECTLKAHGVEYRARGHFRDVAQSRAQTSCRDDGVSASDCRAGELLCESIW